MPFLVLNKVVADALTKYIEKLLPVYRVAILGFDVFEVSELNNSLEPVEIDETPPHYCIILDVNFLRTSAHQIIGNICYFKEAPRARIVKCIQAYICDLYKIGIDVVASVSSGREEVIKILEEFSWNNPGIRDLSYSAGEHSGMVHFFDPNWLVARINDCFKTNDINIVIDDTPVGVRSLDVFLQHKYKQFVSNFNSASKRILAKKKLSPIEKSGFDYFGTYFDRLSDTFSGFRGNKSPLTEDINDYSIHHMYWRVSINILSKAKLVPKIEDSQNLQLDNAPKRNKSKVKMNTKIYSPPAHLVILLQVMHDALYPKPVNSLYKFRLEELLEILRFSSPRSEQFLPFYEESYEQVHKIFLELVHKRKHFLKYSEKDRANMIQHIFSIINNNLKKSFPQIINESNNWKEINIFKMWILTLTNCLILYENLKGLLIHSLDPIKLNIHAVYEMVKHVQMLNGIIKDEEDIWGYNVISKDRAEYAMTGQCSTLFRK